MEVISLSNRLTDTGLTPNVGRHEATCLRKGYYSATTLKNPRNERTLSRSVEGREWCGIRRCTAHVQDGYETNYRVLDRQPEPSLAFDTLRFASLGLM